MVVLVPGHVRAVLRWQAKSSRFNSVHFGTILEFYPELNADPGHDPDPFKIVRIGSGKFMVFSLWQVTLTGQQARFNSSPTEESCRTHHQQFMLQEYT
jgi:hypothetical protein